jgi:hypothetical protein
VNDSDRILVNDEMRSYLRSLPLLLMSSLLMVGAAWAFFKGKDNTASIAAFSAGLILLGAGVTALQNYFRAKWGLT